MLIKINPNGTITEVIRDRVFQGSNEANNLIIVAPFATNTVVEVSYELPNGIITQPYLVSNGKIFDLENAVWSTSITGYLTAFNGVVKYQIKFLSPTSGDDSTTLATYTGQFTVEKGVVSGPVPDPDPDVYDQILILLGQLNENKVGRISEYDEYSGADIFNIDGVKDPFNYYKKFVHDVTDGEDTTEKTGYLFVSFVDGKQQEIFYTTDGNIYIRTIEFVGDTPKPETLEFVNINSGVLKELGDRIDDAETEIDKKLDKVETVTEKIQVYVKRPDGTQDLLDVTDVGGGAVDDVTTKLNAEDKVEVVAIANTNGVITGDEIRDFFTLNIYEAGD